MFDISNPYIISALIAAIPVIIGYALLVPRKTDNFSPEILEDNSRNTQGIRIASRIGSELYSLLPQSVNIKGRKNDRIESLIIRSGNPWRMTVDEFFFFQFVSALLGFLISFPIYLFTSSTVNIPWYVITIACTGFGFMIPRIKYNEQAKNRDIDFKRQLPDALTLINTSLAGGVTFPQALRDSIPNMREGVLRDEFKEILRQIDSGRTLGNALENFSKRAPNESIRTFINAIREAAELNVPINQVLTQQAKSSRAEYMSLLHQKTAALDSKIMGALTPTMLAALIIITLAPGLNSLMKSLG